MVNELFQQVEIVRSRTLKLLQETTEEKADKIPQGFSNNIRWNLGHILTVQEQLVFYFSGESLEIPEHYVKFFANKTSPADWDMEPPSIEELESEFKKQTERIKTTFADRLNEEIASPFRVGGDKELKTVGELIAFTLYHEGLHQGIINAMKRIV